MNWWDRWKIRRVCFDHYQRGHVVVEGYCFTCDRDLSGVPRP